MKQVQVIIRDGRKVVAKQAYTSRSQYNCYAHEFISENLMPGMEVEIRVGRQYSEFKLQSELDDLVHIDYEFKDIDSAIYSMTRNSTLIYYVNNYLPEM